MHSVGRYVIIQPTGTPLTLFPSLGVGVTVVVVVVVVVVMVVVDNSSFGRIATTLVVLCRDRDSGSGGQKTRIDEKAPDAGHYQAVPCVC